MNPRKSFTISALIIAAAAVAAAVVFPTETARFDIPVAFTFSGEDLLVVEKNDNTILRLRGFSPGAPMHLEEERAIEPDDDRFYYMVRDLYPAPGGVMVHSYIYDRRTTDFLGYRFNLYRDIARAPETVFTIFLKEPDESPELRYAAGPGGRHYFANNCRGQRCVWRLPEDARGVVMTNGVPPAEIQELGDRNGEFGYWMSLFVDPEGTTYLSSGEDDQIVRFDSEGKRLRAWGRPGRERGELLAPVDVFLLAEAPGGEPRLTVAGTGNRDWVCFDREGEPVRVIEPLEKGYPYIDILVGRIFDIAGRNLSYDLANKCLVVAGPTFEAVEVFRRPARLRTVLLWLGAGLLVLLIAARDRLAALWRRRRIPVFFKIMLIFAPLVVGGFLISSRARKISYQAYLEESRLRSANLARAILNSVPVEELENINRPEDRGSETYEKIFAAADRLIDRKNVPQTPKWIIHKIAGGRYYFGINSWRGPIFEPFIVPAQRRMFLDALVKKEPAWGRFVDDQGEWVSYLLPVLDRHGEVINVIEIYRSTEEMARIEQETLSRVKENAVLIVISFTLLALVFSWLFVRRLKRLTVETREISRGDFSRRVDSRARDEVGDLGRAFNHMAEDLKNYTRELEKTTAEKEKIQSELRLAHQIQQDILPHVFPPEVASQKVELFGRMVPAREVGGDFYDYIMIDDHHIGVAIADVSGKGVPASLFMMVTRTLLFSNASFNREAAETIAKVNRLLCLNNTSCTFVTLFYFVCDLRTGRLEYCNAGHNPPVVRKGGAVRLLREPGETGQPALGILEDADYRQGRMTLDPGDVLLLYTDGVTEWHNRDNELFGEERLLRAVAEAGDLPARDLAATVFAKLEAFGGEVEQFDDTTMLVFRYLGHP
ncbi:MAG TPA: SpoIIE family protein phosphatase [bacterium]|nr:SpoIIE family protein phosphatase [bacterium]HPQ65688.1 SpoIIE family protein phosphatase [bacterium]